MALMRPTTPTPSMSRVTARPATVSEQGRQQGAPPGCGSTCGGPRTVVGTPREGHVHAEDGGDGVGQAGVAAAHDERGCSDATNTVREFVRIDEARAAGKRVHYSEVRPHYSEVRLHRPEVKVCGVLELL